MGVRGKEKENKKSNKTQEGVNENTKTRSKFLKNMSSICFVDKDTKIHPQKTGYNLRRVMVGCTSNFCRMY